MELKVWVEGIQRVVCGVSETTTCQDVVYALAHATGKTGRFTLIERWRNSERLLAPQEHPLKILLKWGEHASDVQLILQRSALEPKTEKTVNNQLVNSRGAQQLSHQRVSQTAIVDSPPSRASPNSPLQSKDIKKSLTFSGAHSGSHADHPPEVGITPGFSSPPFPQSKYPDHNVAATPHPIPPQYQNHSRPPGSMFRPSAPPPYELVRRHPPPAHFSKQRRPPPPNPYGSPRDSFMHPMIGGPRAPRELPPYRDPPPPPMPSHPTLVKIVSHGNKQSGLQLKSDDRNRFKNDRPYNDAQTNQDTFNKTAKRDQVKKTPPHESSPGSNHLLTPSSSSLINRSPLKSNNAEVRIKNDSRGDINENLIMNNIQSNIEQPIKSSPKEDSVIKDIIKQLGKHDDNCLDQRTEEVIVDSHYKDLVHLVNQQREKLSSQQIELTKYEAEIAFTEGRWKEEESRLNYIQNEIIRLENLPDDNSEAQYMQNVPLEQLEDQFKEAKRSELKSQEDIASIQTKLEDNDHQLVQMNHRIRIMHETIQEEQRKQQIAKETFKEEEQDAILREIEKLQMTVLQASKQAEHAQNLSQQLSQEMTDAECLLGDKRKEIEALRQAMKDANMEALTMTPPDDAKALSENRIGNGTSRRMKGSPRQLETAVPTSKNPHGVWV